MNATFDETAVDQKTLARLLDQGQLLLVRENEAGRLQRITGGILVERPPADVWNVIVDYRNYPRFMPSIEAAEIVADRGEVKDVRFRIKLKLLVSLSLEYVLRTRFRAPTELTWELLSSKGSKIKASDGSWKLTPLDGGKRTAAFYSLYTDLSDAVWGLDRLLKNDPSMEVAINASTCLLVLKAVKNRGEHPGWTRTN